MVIGSKELQDPAYRATLLKDSWLLRVTMHLCNTFITMDW